MAGNFKKWRENEQNGGKYEKNGGQYEKMAGNMKKRREIRKRRLLFDCTVLGTFFVH
jgi:hypothetical protein